ncbi:MAG: hypothetical protein G01um101416_293 [Microgenomates group bacterium Gr01-1014_16]|nr:MAG: hypothetical protein G01um101416_293 [Microgenomates group bacterium Gr01-1014_16]
MTAPQENGAKGAPKSGEFDITEGFVKAARMDFPYLRKLDEAMAARGDPDELTRIRGEVGQVSNIAGQLRLPEIAINEAKTALANVPIGAERRGGEIAKALLKAAPGAEGEAQKILDKLVADGLLESGVADKVGGWVGGEMVRLAAQVHERGSLSPRQDVLDAVGSVSGQINSDTWDMNVWEMRVKAAREAGGGDNKRDEEETTGSSARQAPEGNPEKEWWQNPLVDKAATVALGIVIEKAGDALDLLLKQYEADRNLGRRMKEEGRPMVESARPAGGAAREASETEAAPAAPAVPAESVVTEAANNGQEGALLKILDRVTTVLEKQEERNQGDTEERKLLRETMEKIAAEAKKGKSIEDQFNAVVEREKTCSRCGAPKETGAACSYCKAGSAEGAMLKALEILRGGGGGSGGTTKREAGVSHGQPPITGQDPDAITKALERAMGRGTGYGDFIRRIKGQSAAHTNWTDFPPRWYQELDQEAKDQAELYESLANGAYVKKLYGPTNLEAVQKNEALPAIGKLDIQQFYETAGGREALEQLVQRYFEQDDSPEPNGTFRVRFKNKEAMEEFCDISKFTKAKEGVAMGLIAHEGIANEAGMFNVEPKVVAEGKVANAWNLIFLSHLAESADKDRKLPPGTPVYSEQVRTEFHPLAKIKAKLKLHKTDEEAAETIESWGGSLGNWLAENGMQPSIREKLGQPGMTPFPETMFVSMLEVIGEKGGPSLAERLINGEAIQWDKVEAQEFKGYYGDLWSSVTTVNEYVTGDEKKRALPAKTTSAMEEAWGVDLANALAKIRGSEVGKYLGRYINTPESLGWIEANCLGVDQDSRNLRLEKRPYLFAVISNMTNSRLKHVVDPLTGEKYVDNSLDKKIQSILKASGITSVFSGR